MGRRWAEAERLFAPRHATVSKTARERSDRRRPSIATDAPGTPLSTRFFTDARIISAAADSCCTRADAPFCRGVESERTPSPSPVTSTAIGVPGRNYIDLETL